MIWDNDFVSGSGWHAWVRPHQDHWRWEAVCLSASTAWEPAPTEEAAKAAAASFIRANAEVIAARAEQVLKEIV